MGDERNLNQWLWLNYDFGGIFRRSSAVQAEIVFGDRWPPSGLPPGGHPVVLGCSAKSSADLLRIFHSAGRMGDR